MKRIYFILLLFVMAFFIYFISQNPTFKKIVTLQSETPTPSIMSTQTSKQLCVRNTPYKISPEFERGVSLLYQRIEENPDAPYVSGQEKLTMQTLLQIRNCLEIQFKNLEKSNAEGYFLFDSKSSVDDLKIYVDNRYKDYDDVLTALLLSHEITHAAQFVEYKQNNQNLTCVEKEVNAIKMELQLVRFFNDEEKQSLSARVQSEEIKSQSANDRSLPQLPENQAYADIKSLFDINSKVGPMCNTPTTGDLKSWILKDAECHEKVLTEYVTQLVKNNPFYQKECGL